MTPSPPIWIRIKMITWPKKDQCVAVSCTIKPVTQTAEVDVKSVWLNGVTLPSDAEMGSINSNAPKRITPKKPIKMI